MLSDPPIIHKTAIWKAALLTFLAMCTQDILGTCMVVFESRLNWQLAGAFDVFGYLAGLICSVLALDSILKNGWRTKRSLALIGAVSVANFIGTAIGVLLVTKLTRT